MYIDLYFAFLACVQSEPQLPPAMNPASQRERIKHRSFSDVFLLSQLAVLSNTGPSYLGFLGLLLAKNFRSVYAEKSIRTTKQFFLFYSIFIFIYLFCMEREVALSKWKAIYKSQWRLPPLVEPLFLERGEVYWCRQNICIYQWS